MIHPLRDTTRMQLSYGRRSFDLLVWASPTHKQADVVEMAALLTPRGGADTWLSRRSGPMPVASAAAARRLLLLSFSLRVPLRIHEFELGLRRDATGREANIVGPESAAARKALLAAVERLAVGAGWLSGLADAELAAAALWRGTLLSNGLIRGAKTTFALRAPNGARAATLRVAAELLGVEVQTTRTSQGLRIQLDDDAAETLLDRLAQPSGVARVLVTEGR